MSTRTRKTSSDSSETSAKPHYHGHRERLRARVVESGAESLADYEVLEALLFAARPNGDMKPLAKRLIQRFGSLSGVLGADPARLREVQGVGPAAIAVLKVGRETARRLACEETSERPVIASGRVAKVVETWGLA